MRAYEELLVETVYVNHRASLVRKLSAFTRDRELGEDLAQDAFLRLAREIDAGRTPDNPGAWLHRVGVNIATSRARHLQVASRHEAELPRPAEPASPEHVVIEGELAAAVGSMMEDLSTPERRALVLAAHGFAGIEISQALGRTPAATRTLMCRARAKIRERVRLAGFAA